MENRIGRPQHPLMYLLPSVATVPHPTRPLLTQPHVLFLLLSTCLLFSSRCDLFPLIPRSLRVFVCLLQVLVFIPFLFFSERLHHIRFPNKNEAQTTFFPEFFDLRSIWLNPQLPLLFRNSSPLGPHCLSPSYPGQRLPAHSATCPLHVFV